MPCDWGLVRRRDGDAEQRRQCLHARGPGETSPAGTLTSALQARPGVLRPRRRTQSLGSPSLQSASGLRGHVSSLPITTPTPVSPLVAVSTSQLRVHIWRCSFLLEAARPHSVPRDRVLVPDVLNAECSQAQVPSLLCPLGREAACD